MAVYIVVVVVVAAVVVVVVVVVVSAAAAAAAAAAGVVVVVVVVVAVVGCHRFAPLLISDTVLGSWAFAPNAFYTHNLSKGNLSQNLSPYDLSPQTLLYTYALIFNFDRALNETNVFAPRPSFPQKHFLHKKCVKRMSQGFNESHVLAGPVQGLLVCRIALVHGGRWNTQKAVK